MNSAMIYGTIAIALSVLMYMKGADDKANELTTKYQAEKIEQTKQTMLANSALHDAVADIDAKATKERFDAEELIDSLLVDVRTGKQRLYVNTKTTKCAVPNNSSTSSVDNVTRRTQLDPDTTERLFRLTARGDKAIIQLGACQAYAKSIQEINH